MPTDSAGSSVPEAARAAAQQAEHFKVCGCHDSWDQCPCADSGHPADGSCDCCPLGTGICGPWPATARADAIAAYWEHPQANSIGLRGDAIWAAVQAALPTLVAAAVAEERATTGRRIEALTSALERTRDNFVAAVRGTPVRDMAETLAEVRAALASPGEES